MDVLKSGGREKERGTRVIALRQIYSGKVLVGSLEVCYDRSGWNKR